jgi:enamine deaminase RidA (YjgF/YER057c/UK114 family)
MEVGNLLYLSGHGPVLDDGTLITGKVGAGLTIEQGKNAARQTGLGVLSTLRNYLRTLDRVRRLIKTTGWVNCTSDFVEQPQVINGFSELMAEVFGNELGIGVRSALGTNALPLDMAVEVECLFEIA